MSRRKGKPRLFTKLKRLNIEDFVDETDEDYGEDWLSFRNEKEDITISGYYYHNTGYRIEILFRSYPLIITSDFTEEDTFRYDHPQVRDWMNLWWDLYNTRYTW